MCLQLEEQRRQVMEFADRLTEARSLYTKAIRLFEENDQIVAAEYILRAAEMGDAIAQCRFGTLHENGFFGEPDEAKAAFWYRKSADQRLPDGQYRLGACYQFGKGVDQDYEEAARLFQQAARRGHTEAAECLAMLRDLGIGD